MKRTLIITFCLIVTTALCALAQRESTDFAVLVENVLITPDNASNVLVGKGKGKDGCVSYDFATSTLTLKQARLTSNIKITHNNPAQKVTIRLEGDNEMNIGAWTAIRLFTPAEITGPGSLFIRCTSTRWTSGIRMESDNPYLYLKITDCKVVIDTSIQPEKQRREAIFSPVMRDGILVVDHATLETEGLVAGMKNILLQRCHITNNDEVEIAGIKGKGCVVVIDKSIIDPNQERYNYGMLTIAPDDTYPIFIGATQVNNTNCKQLSVGQTHGMASYDPSSNTLTLHNFEFDAESEEGIRCDYSFMNKPFVLNLEGNNRIYSQYTSVMLNGPSTITGKGTANFVNEVAKNSCAGIFIADEQTLTIKNCSLTLEGAYALSGTGKKANLVIDNANITAVCKNQKSGSCVDGFASLTFENASITEPQNARFDKKLSGITVNGETLCNEQVIIKAKGNNSIVQPAMPGYNYQAYTQGGVLYLISDNKQPFMADVYTLDGKKVAHAMGSNNYNFQLTHGTSYIVVLDNVKTEKVIVD